MHAPVQQQPLRGGTPRNPLFSRVFWFLAGAGLNYALISVPFKYLRAHSDLPVWAVSGLSMGVASTFFFIWNTQVNFRTGGRKRDALLRYSIAVGVMWALSSATLTFLKGFNAEMHFQMGRFPLDLDVVATQFFLSGLKFALYHFWVFPVPKRVVIPQQPNPLAR
jgi:hypothetical protein